MGWNQPLWINDGLTLSCALRQCLCQNSFRKHYIDSNTNYHENHNIHCTIITPYNLAKKYNDFFSNFNCLFWVQQEGNESNYWLNAVSFSSQKDKFYFLKETNKKFVMTRPIWVLLYKLPIYQNCQTLLDGTAERLYDTTVNIPSSVPSLK